MFAVRIVTTDHYQGIPIPGLDVQFSDFRGSEVKKVPVIRVFGATSAGQKTCMHVHGVFPYLYVPYDGTQPWDRYLRLFAASLDKAINVAQGHASADIHHVYKITLVSGIPMYGYHEKEQQFLKIYFYNPGIIRKAADLLLGGAVMNKGFQPHETHIPYNLQMFIDYNLYGMNMINVAAVKFRRKSETAEARSSQESHDDQTTPRTPVASLQDLISTSVLDVSRNQIWDEESIPSDFYMDEGVVRQSTCELEVDIVAADILNRLEVDDKAGKNPGLAAIWEDEKQRKRNLGESSQIMPPDSQEREDVVISDSDEYLRQRFQEIVLNMQPYIDSQSDTMSESSQEDILSTSSAADIDLHLSQREDELEGSQDTVIMDEEEIDAPVVNMDSIHRVVSMSQSFSGLPSSQPLNENQDRSLAQILASLADEGSPSSSQAAASEVTVLEEKDSILQEQAHVPDDEVLKADEEEILEMSQIVWDDGSQDDDSQQPKQDKDTEIEGFNIEGLDSTWIDSQSSSQVPAEEDEEDDLKIPQLDGSTDEKPAATKKGRKKRLGATGPVVSGGYSNQVQQGQGQSGLMYPNQGYNMYGNQGNQMYGMNEGYDTSQGGFQQQYQQPAYGNYGNDNYSNLDWNQQMQYNYGGMHSEQSNNFGMQNWGQSNRWSNLMKSPNGNTVSSHSNMTSPHGNITSPHGNLASPHGSLNSPHGSIQSPSQMNSQNHMGSFAGPVNSSQMDSSYDQFNSPLSQNNSIQDPWNISQMDSTQGPNSQITSSSEQINSPNSSNEQANSSQVQLTQMNPVSLSDSSDGHMRQLLSPTQHSGHVNSSQGQVSSQTFSPSHLYSSVHGVNHVNSQRHEMKASGQMNPMNSPQGHLTQLGIPQDQLNSSQESSSGGHMNPGHVQYHGHMNQTQMTMNSSDEMAGYGNNGNVGYYNMHENYSQNYGFMGSQQGHHFYGNHYEAHQHSGMAPNFQNQTGFRDTTQNMNMVDNAQTTKMKKTSKPRKTPSKPRKPRQPGSKPRKNSKQISSTPAEKDGDTAKKSRKNSAVATSSPLLTTKLTGNMLEKLLMVQDEDDLPENLPRSSSSNFINSVSSQNLDKPQVPNSSVGNHGSSSSVSSISSLSPISEMKNNENVGCLGNGVSMDRQTSSKQVLSPNETKELFSSLSSRKSFCSESVSSMNSHTDNVNSSTTVNAINVSSSGSKAVHVNTVSDSNPNLSYLPGNKSNIPHPNVKHVSMSEIYCRNNVSDPVANLNKSASLETSPSSYSMSQTGSQRHHSQSDIYDAKRHSLSSLQSLVSSVSEENRYGVSVRNIATDGKPYCYNPNEFDMFVSSNYISSSPSLTAASATYTHPEGESSSYVNLDSNSNRTGCVAEPIAPRNNSSSSLMSPPAVKTLQQDIFLQKDIAREPTSKQKCVARPSLVRSFSTPITSPFKEKKRRGRPPKSLSLCKSRTFVDAVKSDTGTSEPRPSGSKYTFSFHVPTPVYKRLKCLHRRNSQPFEEIKVVRMHPMDARRYSLLKIGREIVKIPKLSSQNIQMAENGQTEDVESLLERHSLEGTLKRKLSREDTDSNPAEVENEQCRTETIDKMSDSSIKTNFMNPQKMIVQEQQLCSEAVPENSRKEDCHNIQKITLSSIIESVLRSSMDGKSEAEDTVGEVNSGNENSHQKEAEKIDTEKRCIQSNVENSGEENNTSDSLTLSHSTENKSIQLGSEKSADVEIIGKDCTNESTDIDQGTSQKADLSTERENITTVENPDDSLGGVGDSNKLVPTENQHIPKSTPDNVHDDKNGQNRSKPSGQSTRQNASFILAGSLAGASRVSDFQDQFYRYLQSKSNIPVFKNEQHIKRNFDHSESLSNIHDNNKTLTKQETERMKKNFIVKTQKRHMLKLQRKISPAHDSFKHDEQHLSAVEPSERTLTSLKSRPPVAESSSIKQCRDTEQIILSDSDDLHTKESSGDKSRILSSETDIRNHVDKQTCDKKMTGLVENATRKDSELPNNIILKNKVNSIRVDKKLTLDNGAGKKKTSFESFEKGCGLGKSIGSRNSGTLFNESFQNYIKKSDNIYHREKELEVKDEETCLSGKNGSEASTFKVQKSEKDDESGKNTCHPSKISTQNIKANCCIESTREQVLEGVRDQTLSSSTSTQHMCNKKSETNSSAIVSQNPQCALPTTGSTAPSCQGLLPSDSHIVAESTYISSPINSPVSQPDLSTSQATTHIPSQLTSAQSTRGNWSSESDNLTVTGTTTPDAHLDDSSVPQCAQSTKNHFSQNMSHAQKMSTDCGHSLQASTQDMSKASNQPCLQDPPVLVSKSDLCTSTDDVTNRTFEVDDIQRSVNPCQNNLTSASRDMISRPRSASTSSDGSCRLSRERKNRACYSDSDFVYDLGRKRKCSEIEGVKRKRKRLVPGVDFIVTGKFKGHRKMAVHVERLNITNGTVVLVSDYSNSHYRDGFLSERETNGIRNNGMLGSCDNIFEKFQNCCETKPCSGTGTDESSKDSTYFQTKKGLLSLSARRNSGDMIEISSSDESNMGGCSNESRSKFGNDFMHKSDNPQSVIDNDDLMDIKDSCDDNESDSTGKQNKKLSKKKKKMTKNQRLHMAFTSASYKTRRKKSPVHSGKLMTSLSLLHEATIANLVDPVVTNGECLDDCKSNYEDVMFKLSLFSPPNSDKGDNSPPQPLSPEEFTCGQRGITWSTSDAQSVVLENGLSPISADKEDDMSPVYPVTNNSVENTVPISVDESPEKHQSHESRDRTNKHSTNQINISEKDALDPSHSRSCESNDSPNNINKFTSFEKDSIENMSLVKNKDGSNLETLEAEEEVSMNCDESGKITLSQKSSSSLDSVDVIEPSPDANETHFKQKFLKSDGFLEEIKDVNCTSYNCQEIRRTRLTNKVHFNSPSKLGPLHFKRKAVVKLQPLSLHEIEKYCSGKVSFDKLEGKENIPVSNNGIDSEMETNGDVSPPDLGPPNIPKFEKEEMEEFNTPPKLIPSQPPRTSLQSPSVTDKTICESGSERTVDQKLSGCEIISSKDSKIQTENEDSIVNTMQKNCGKIGKECVGFSDKTDLVNVVKHSEMSCDEQDSTKKKASDDSETSKTKSIKNDEKTEENFSKSKGKSKTLYTPLRRPPTRQSVRETASIYGLKTCKNQAAFCSNPDDVPEKPRELGGRVLNLQSNRVSFLPDFESTVGCEGIANYRNIMMINDHIFNTQTENDNLLHQMSKEPELRFALLGDKKITITPCLPAPSRASVEDWLKKHEMYKKMKLMKEIKNVDRNNGDKVEQIDQRQRDSIPTESKLSSGSIVGHIPKNSLVKELSFDNNMEDSVQTDSPSPVKVIKITRTKSDQGQSFDDSQEKDIISPSPPSEKLKISRWDRTDSSLRLYVKKENIKEMTNSPVACSQVNTTPITPKVRYSIDPETNDDKSRDLANGDTPKSVRESENKFHSTPLQKKRLSHLFQTTVTPIANKVRDNMDQAASKTVLGNCSESSPGFLAPRHIPLHRRMSGAEKSSLMSDSQMKQFSTPLNKKGSVSQIDGPTPKNSFGFKVSQQNLQDAKALHEVQNLTVISLELHAESRRDLRPDPEVDQILAIFYEIYNDFASEKVKKNISAAIIVDKKSWESQKALQKKLKEKSSSEREDDTKIRSDSPQPSTSRDSTVNPRPRNRSPSPQPSTSSDFGPKFRKSPIRKKARSRSPSPSHSKVPKTDDKYIQDTLLQKSGVDGDLRVTYVQNEQEMFDTLIELILKWDPDILVGYEIQNFSWGYLLQRASHLSINLCAKISRIPDEKKKSSFKAESDEWGAAYSSEIHLAGRVILNLWRLLRHEVALNIYSFENVAFHVLHQRIPHFTTQTLNSWFQHRTHLYRWRFVQHYQTRVKGNMQIIDQLDLIGRTSEFARVFGIEFYHVLSRGSQYRVESMMLRLAKPLNFIPVSPNVLQRARMRAPECIPLTLEPESRFYSEPVVVLDFQSLYPSIMIAHNYCFSTCVGRLEFLEKAHEGAIELGCTHLRISPRVLNKIKDDVTVSPNGVVFVKQHVRKGIISSMVEEILGTRIMVKKGMKDHKKDKGLHRLLDARQLGLKLIANVTYGYTAANFSGRMPCIEVGDSIVRKARETLERAIKLVEDTPQWGARVVYGDTDSMFIELKGRSKEEAFKIGYEICDAVTAMNPKPIKLKFEKVYLPCVLQTKKRYVGFSYETPDQKEPIFDAKGIETVRRDSCAAVSKILERSVKILFNSKDVSLVKEYVLRQCRKLMEGKVSMQDCIFAKEYRGMKGYKPGACVPALEISKKLLRHDRRSEPRVGERVPYVIVYGSPGLPLIQLVRQPHEVLNDATLRLNATYYIVKQILPPLDRLFSLLGVDVFRWYNDMPKVTRMAPMSSAVPETRKGTISQYFQTTNCPVCEKQTNQSICAECMKSPSVVCVTLCDRIRTWEKVQRDLIQICNTCMGCQDEKQLCDSLDCPIMFRRLLSERDVNKGSQLRDIITKMLDF